MRAWCGFRGERSIDIGGCGILGAWMQMKKIPAQTAQEAKEGTRERGAAEERGNGRGESGEFAGQTRQRKGSVRGVKAVCKQYASTCLLADGQSGIFGAILCPVDVVLCPVDVDDPDEYLAIQSEPKVFYQI